MADAGRERPDRNYGAPEMVAREAWPDAAPDAGAS